MMGLSVFRVRHVISVVAGLLLLALTLITVGLISTTDQVEANPSPSGAQACVAPPPGLRQKPAPRHSPRE